MTYEESYGYMETEEQLKKEFEQDIFIATFLIVGDKWKRIKTINEAYEKISKERGWFK